jgi:hypothetical protein
MIKKIALPFKLSELLSEKSAYKRYKRVNLIFEVFVRMVIFVLRLLKDTNQKDLYYYGNLLD